MTLGEKLIQLRKEHNMTQADLGEKLNMTAQAISKWERNQAEPDILTLKRIATIFNISIDELLNEEQEFVVAEEKEKYPEKAKSDEVLGFCANCGCIIKQDNFGMSSPKMLCSKCKDKLIKVAKAKKAAEEKQEQDKVGHMCDKRGKAIFWGVLGAALALIILTVVGIVDEEINSAALYAAWFGGTIVFSYCLFSFIAVMVIGDSWVEEIVFWFLTRSVRWPGVIFSFDIDGFIFLIAVKVLFAILGAIIGFFMGLIGLALGCVLSPFAFPYYMHVLNKKIKGEIPIDEIDLMD